MRCILTQIKLPRSRVQEMSNLIKVLYLPRCSIHSVDSIPCTLAMLHLTYSTGSFKRQQNGSCKKEI